MDIVGRHARVAIARRHADEPGGDLAIVIPGSHDDVFCFLADVTGHGVRASRFARELDELVRVLATRVAPGALLGEINALMERGWLPNLFASAVCVSLDAARGFGTVAVAGQLPPVMRTATTHAMSIPPSPPLGMFSSQVYSEVRFELLDGDVMVLVTDGITDSLATERDALGLHRLLELVDRGPRDFTEMCAGLLTLEEGRESHDDATIIAIGRSTWAIGHPLCSIASR
jgi:serine phosphatase RsbU (regulator of sigma subunit)